MCYRKSSDFETAFTRYFFEKDLFGNIVAVYNEAGTKVANYCYDAWGNCTVLTNTNGIGTMNPFRYRGYYLDTETNLYYLQSRYYDSYVGRFIYADGTINGNGDLIGYNLFAYCSNNPVMYTDYTGKGLIGLFLQIAISIDSYVLMAIASIFDEDIRNDMNSIQWNPFNENADAVLNSSKVSFYKGAPVFRTDLNRSGTFMAIFLTKENSAEIVKHEWGHIAQQVFLDPIPYGIGIGIPSALELGNWNDYYDAPWEATADYLGGAHKEHHVENLEMYRWKARNAFEKYRPWNP